MKKRNYPIYLLIFAVYILCNAMSCDNGNLYYCDVLVKNCSDDIIYVCCGQTNQTEEYTLEDVYNSKGQHGKFIQEIPQGRVCAGGSCWVYSTEDTDNFDDYKANELFYLFVINKDTWDSHTLDEILHNNIYDKKLVYTYNELKAMNFQINYMGE